MDLAVSSEPCRADDAGGVQQLGRHDLGIELELGNELVGVLTDTAANHDQVGPQQCLKPLVVALEAWDPLLVGEALPLLDAGGGPGLGVVAVDLDDDPAQSWE